MRIFASNYCFCRLHSVLYSRDASSSPSPNYLAVVIYDGRVMWIPQVNLATHCLIDVTHFPFDTQECRIKFGSWAYSGEEVYASGCF